MQALPTAMRRLEHLQSLVDEYVPLVHQPDDRAKELVGHLARASPFFQGR